MKDEAEPGQGTRAAQSLPAWATLLDEGEIEHFEELVHEAIRGRAVGVNERFGPADVLQSLAFACGDDLGEGPGGIVRDAVFLLTMRAGHLAADLEAQPFDSEAALRGLAAVRAAWLELTRSASIARRFKNAEEAEAVVQARRVQSQTAREGVRVPYCHRETGELLTDELLRQLVAEAKSEGILQKTVLGNLAMAYAGPDGERPTVEGLRERLKNRKRSRKR